MLNCTRENSFREARLMLGDPGLCRERKRPSIKADAMKNESTKIFERIKVNERIKVYESIKLNERIKVYERSL